MSTLLQRSHDRFSTNLGWLQSQHSFNFGPHYSPQHDGFGLLLVNNDDIVGPNSGFGTHGHANMEIVTWVLSGQLQHSDSEGNNGVLYPGLAQRMSAGTGIRHSEMNASTSEPVHLVQMWVLPDTPNIHPGYEQRDLNEELALGGLVAIASGQGHQGAISLHQHGAVLWGARLAAEESVDVPSAGHVHLFVALGSGDLERDGSLFQGDAARLTQADSQRFTATSDHTEILIWTMS